jgi:hypothetical protein
MHDIQDTKRWRGTTTTQAIDAADISMERQSEKNKLGT